MSAVIFMVNHYKTEAEIEAVVRGFESCSTAKSEFTHVSHLTVAVWYLRRSSVEPATEQMRASLFRFIDHYGIEGKYHETLTVFWMRVVRRQLDDLDPKLTLLEAANAVVETLSDSRLVFEYYSEALLWSDEARSVWVEPDLKPLDYPPTRTRASPTASAACLVMS